MNEYEARIAAKKERLAEKAKAVRKESQATYSEARKLSGVIPFGQPILVGHHSESRHRSHLKKVSNTFEKSFKLDDKADHYERKAAAVGTGGISSFDPEAAQKIQTKIDSLKANNEHMKEVNRLYKKHYTQAFKKLQDEKEAFKQAAKALSETHEDAAKELIQRAGFYAFAPYGRLKPYAPSAVEIRRLEKRLESLANAKQEDSEIQKDGFKVVFDGEEMRIKFIFDEIPSEEARKILSSHAFKFSRYSEAWVRKLTGNAKFSTRCALEALEKIKV
jgi:DNA repair exonuclease SbcCD ATPase subunit